MKNLSNKKYYCISGILGFFGAITASAMDLPAFMGTLAGNIFLWKNPIAYELAILFVISAITLYLMARKKEHPLISKRRGSLWFVAYLFLFFVAGLILGFLGFLACFIIGFRTMSPSF